MMQWQAARRLVHEDELVPRGAEEALASVLNDEATFEQECDPRSKWEDCVQTAYERCKQILTGDSDVPWSSFAWTDPYDVLRLIAQRRPMHVFAWTLRHAASEERL